MNHKQQITWFAHMHPTFSVESLFYEMDFIGISAYHPLPLGFTENELQVCFPHVTCSLMPGIT